MEEKQLLSESFTISDALTHFVSRFEVVGNEMEQCGLFGYSTFNCVKYTENIDIRESREERNDAPDLLYILYKYLLVFNHFTDEISLIELQGENEVSNLMKVEALINQRNFATYNFFTEGEEYSTITDEQFKEMCVPAYSIACGATCSRLCSHVGLFSVSLVMISKCTVRCDPSIPLPISFISISADTVFLAHRPRRTARSTDHRSASTPLREQPNEAATTRRIGRRWSFC